ncbi:MAG: hypothetical protein MJZ81_07180 [Bacteroidales bacterium]|nr:hypothetical protein [Bacteroidales bacterium]
MAEKRDTRRVQVLGPRVCEICGRTYTPTSPRSKTCSPACSAELNRRNCLDRARDIAFLRPYKIPSEPQPSAPAEPVSDPSPTQTTSPTDRTANPEPSSDAERASQTADVEFAMSLPASDRYPHSVRWSAFQRRLAVSIERRRLSDGSFFAPYSFGSNDSPSNSPDRRTLPSIRFSDEQPEE